MARPSKTWKIKKREIVFSAQPWLDVWKETIELPGGQVVSDYYKIASPDSVTIVAIDRHGLVLAARQYRHGIQGSVWVVPAGFIDRNETPLAAAKRELLEETGYMAAHWVHVGTFIRDVNRWSGRAHVFLALNATPTAPPADNDLQSFDTELVDFEQLIQNMLSGRKKGLGPIAYALIVKEYLSKHFPKSIKDKGFSTPTASKRRGKP